MEGKGEEEGEGPAALFAAPVMVAVRAGLGVGLTLGRVVPVGCLELPPGLAP